MQVRCIDRMKKITLKLAQTLEFCLEKNRWELLLSNLMMKVFFLLRQ